MSPKIRNGYANVVAMLSVIGCFFTVWGLNKALEPLNWLMVFIDALYALSFFGLLSYTFGEDIKSKTFFTLLLRCYMLVVALTGILFFPVLDTVVATKVAQASSLISIVTISASHLKWKDFKTCRNLFRITFFFDLVATVLVCRHAFIDGQSLTDTLFMSAMALIRPIISLGILLCYVGRMKVKREEAKD